MKKPKELAITGIILHCPSRDSNNLSRGENLTLPSTHDYYKVSISQTSDTYCNCNACERERYSDNEPLTLIISPVKLEWESEMEVKVEPPVPLKDRHQYLILLEKVCSTLTVLNPFFISLCSAPVTKLCVSFVGAENKRPLYLSVANIWTIESHYRS